MAVARFIFDAGKHRKNFIGGMVADLVGPAAQSSPEAAPRRAKRAGLDGVGADRAIFVRRQTFPNADPCLGLGTTLDDCVAQA
jgi:hypothetical protein